MIILKYWNPQMKIGLEDYRNAWQFSQKIKMHTEVHRGKLCFRSKGSSKRISYEQGRKNLVKRRIIIEDKLPF